GRADDNEPPRFELAGERVAGEVSAQCRDGEARGARKEVAFCPHGGGTDKHDGGVAADGTEDAPVGTLGECAGGAVAPLTATVDARDKVDAEPLLTRRPVQLVEPGGGGGVGEVDGECRPGGVAGDDHAASLSRTWRWVRP